MSLCRCIDIKGLKTSELQTGRGNLVVWRQGCWFEALSSYKTSEVFYGSVRDALQNGRKKRFRYLTSVGLLDVVKAAYDCFKSLSFIKHYINVGVVPGVTKKRVIVSPVFV
ncbi:MAG: hypothetical protein IPI79_15735 [Moraxellaceae bacterium]|nr:hypothetical protein [Moraxellaceae bacterium]